MNDFNRYGSRPGCASTGFHKRQADAQVYGLADWREIIGHCLAHSAGLKVEGMHPGAEAVLADGRRYTLQDAAEASLEVLGMAIPSGHDGFNVIRAGLNTSILPDILVETQRGIAEARKTEQLDAILALTHQMENHNFNASSFSMVDLTAPAPSENTGYDYHVCGVRVTGETVKVHVMTALILVAREALANQDRNVIGSGVNAFLRTALSSQMGLVCAAFESAANMADGAPMFHSDFGNLTAAALDATGLGTAVAALRKMKTETGDACDAAPATVLVHVDDEVAALRLVETLPVDRRPRVVATARLANASSWYLLADQSLFPVLGRVRLEGAPLSGVSFGGLQPAEVRDPETGRNVSYSGLAIPAYHSIGFARLSRVGAVKLTK